MTRREQRRNEMSTTPNYGLYRKLLTYMYRVGPIVAMPPQVDLFVPQALNRNGAETLGTAWVWWTTNWPSTYQSTKPGCHTILKS